MAKIRIYYDKEVDTLDIWFDEPPEEGFSREINDGIIAKYDSKERIVGIEVLFVSKQKAINDVIPNEVKTEFKTAISEFVDTIEAIT